MVGASATRRSSGRRSCAHACGLRTSGPPAQQGHGLLRPRALPLPHLTTLKLVPAAAEGGGAAAAAAAPLGPEPEPDANADAGTSLVSLSLSLSPSTRLSRLLPSRLLLRDCSCDTACGDTSLAASTGLLLPGG